MKLMNIFKRRIGYAVGCLVAALVFGFSTEAHSAVNYLKIQSSGNSTDASLTLSITSIVPAAGSIIHEYNLPMLLMPAQQFFSGGIWSFRQTQHGATVAIFYVSGVPNTINITKKSTGSVQTATLDGAAINLGSAILALPDGLIVGSQKAGSANFDAGGDWSYYITAAHPSGRYTASGYSGCCGTAQLMVWTNGLIGSNGSSAGICVTDGTGMSPGYLSQKCSLNGAITHVIGY